MTYEVIDRVVHDTSGNRSLGDISDRPCPTITVGGLQVNACHYQVHYRLSESPPYCRRSNPT